MDNMIFGKPVKKFPPLTRGLSTAGRGINPEKPSK
jgi:hypothetical protein